MKCVSNKKVYLSQEIAEEALIEAHSQFEYPMGKGPVAVYRCEDCGYYHFTSQGPINSRLLELQKTGKIDRMKQANQWTNALKKKR